MKSVWEHEEAKYINGVVLSRVLSYQYDIEEQVLSIYFTSGDNPKQTIEAVDLEQFYEFSRLLSEYLLY